MKISKEPVMGITRSPVFASATEPGDRLYDMTARAVVTVVAGAQAGGYVTVLVPFRGRVVSVLRTNLREPG